MGNKELGNLGEEIATKYLKVKGYDIIIRNYRYKYGEIDIIAKRDKVLIFIEVKTRRNKKYGAPCEAVTYNKTKKIINTASYFLTYNNYNDYNIRFDVVEVSFDKIPSINHIKDAFRH